MSFAKVHKGTQITTQKMNSNEKKFSVVQFYVCDFWKKSLDPKITFTCDCRQKGHRHLLQKKRRFFHEVEGLPFGSFVRSDQ